jgi:hypothetical protein
MSDTEYESLRREVAKEYDCAFYGGIGHVAVDEKKPVSYEAVGPWVGM